MQPTDASFEKRPIPDWYDDCKLGIFIHWGIYSVPGWAPLSGPIWDEAEREPKLPRFDENPYAEWYFNTMRIAGSPTARHHARTYGADFAYALAHWKELIDRYRPCCMWNDIANDGWQGGPPAYAAP